LGTLAVQYVVAWRAQARRWCLELAFAYLLVALVYAFEPYTLPLGEHPRPLTAALLATAVTLWADGMADYFALSARFVRRLRIATGSAAMVLMATAWAGVLTRLAGHSILAVNLLAAACMALRAARREPRDGHGLVFLVLMLYPGTVLAAWFGGFPTSTLRYLLCVPFAISGMTILTTGLIRAERRASLEVRRAELAEADLRALNESLEQRIAMRTAQLHDMVRGLEAFNRDVSHDLRGPLGGIAEAARMADDAIRRGSPAAASRILPAIAAQAESSVHLIASLLELARVAQAPFVPKRVAIEALVQEALAQVQLADPRSTRVSVTVTAPLPVVEADPVLLRQVFVNLVGNAVKFTREALAPRIEVGVRDGDGARTFFVRDNGTGFDVNRATQLFTPFRRLHGEEVPGHGVGLSIVKRIVERHGGRVWAESTPGHGATFFFTLSGAAGA
jgi:signal transduction histidine kinase